MESNHKLVVPPRPLTPQFVPLSPLDQHMVPTYNMRFLLCFPVSEEANGAELFKTLEESLSHTISALPLIAGHVIPAPGGHVVLEIDAGSGVELRYKDLTRPENSLPGFESYEQLKRQNFPVEELPDSIVSPVGLVPHNPSNAPAVIVQCNFFPDGMLLCVAFHHTVFDANGSGMVTVRWAEERRRLLESNTQVQTTFLVEAMDRITPFLTCVKFDPILGEDFVTTLPPTAKPTEQLTRTLHFSSSALSRLKRLAASRISKTPWVSTNDALSALLFHSVTRARHQQLQVSASPGIDGDSGDVDLMFVCALDARSRMRPPNPHYLGNASFFRLTPLSQTHLLRDPFALDGKGEDRAIPLARTVQTIRERVKQVDHNYIQNFFALLAATPPTTPIRPPLRPGRYFVTSSLTETGVGMADWGRGLEKPDAVRIPNMAGDGSAIILPKAGKGGGLDVVLMMNAAVMNLVLKELEGWADLPILPCRQEFRARL